MEQVATATEQAVPQGSAAPQTAASAPSFGDRYLAHVLRTPLDGAAPTQQEASSAAEESSATDEQPAADASQTDGTPEASTDGNQADAATTTDQKPKLSRAERKRLKQQEASADTSGDDDGDDDPIVATVERVDERLARLESLLQPTPPPSDDVQAFAKAHADTFGEDAEFYALREKAELDRNSLTYEEEERLSTLARNRKAAELTDLKWKRNLTAVAIAAAEQRGLTAEAITSATSPDAIFSAFFEAGKASGSSESSTAATAREAELTARIEKLERATRLVADENEALQERAPAAAARPLVGGLSGSTGSRTRLDPSTTSSRDLIAAGLAERRRQATAGPAARAR